MTDTQVRKLDLFQWFVRAHSENARGQLDDIHTDGQPARGRL